MQCPKLSPYTKQTFSPYDSPGSSTRHTVFAYRQTVWLVISACYFLFPKSKFFGNAIEKRVQIQRKPAEKPNGNPTKSKQFSACYFFGNAKIGKTKIGRCNSKANVKVPRKASSFNRKAMKIERLNFPEMQLKRILKVHRHIKMWERNFRKLNCTG